MGLTIVPGSAAAAGGHGEAAIGAGVRLGLRRSCRRDGVLSLRLQAEQIFVGDIVEFPLPEVLELRARTDVNPSVHAELRAMEHTNLSCGSCSSLECRRARDEM